MTSDEIREEFEAWASLRWPQRIEDWKKNKMCAWEACVQEAFEKAYLAAAEPREKRIAELERERDEWRHKHESLRSGIATVEARLAENEKCLGELSGFAEMDKQRIVELENKNDDLHAALSLERGGQEALRARVVNTLAVAENIAATGGLAAHVIELFRAAIAEEQEKPCPPSQS
jgi:chromosome segregation ATPase